MTLAKTKQAVSTTIQWLRDGQPQASADDSPQHRLNVVIHHLTCAYLEYAFRRRLTTADANYVETQNLNHFLLPQWDAVWEGTVLQSIQHIIDCDKRIQAERDETI